MLAVGSSSEVAMEAIEAFNLKKEVLVACFNSSQNLTLSGDAEGITKLFTYFQSKGIFARELKTNGKGYHSHHMAVVGQHYEDLAQNIGLFPGPSSKSLSPQWISTVTGESVDMELGPNYWRKNLESPVQFSDGIAKIVNESGVCLIEIGPHPVLQLPIQQIISGLKNGKSKVQYFSTLTRGKSPHVSMLSLMGNLFNHGHRIPIAKINREATETSSSGRRGALLLNLPNYRWKYDTPLWVESRASEEYRNRKCPRHDLLGSQIPGGSEIITWRNVLRVKDVPWTKDHRVDGSIVFPAAGYIAMAIEGICQSTNTDPQRLPSCRLERITIHRALVLSEDVDTGVELLTTMSPIHSIAGRKGWEWWQLVISSISGGLRITHASGNICLEGKAQPLRQDLLIVLENTELDSTENWYNTLSKSGLDLRGPFRSLTNIRSERSESTRHILADIALFQGADSKNESFYPLHPATIDGILHASLLASSAGAVNDFLLRLPISVESIRIQLPSSCHRDELSTVYASAKPVGLSTMMGSSEIYSPQHGTIVQIRNCRLVLPFQEKHAVSRKSYPMFNVTWMPDITMADQGDFQVFEKNFSIRYHSSDLEDVNLRRILAAVSLLVFKDPELQILQMDEQHSNATDALLECLDFKSNFPRCRSFTKSSPMNILGAPAKYTKSEVSGEYEFVQGKLNTNERFDLAILLSQVPMRGFVEKIREFLSPNGSILGYCPPSDIIPLANEGFSVLRLVEDESLPLILAHRIEQKKSVGITEPQKIILVETTSERILNDLLETRLSESYVQTVHRVRWNDVSPSTISKGSTVVSTTELNKAFFSGVSEEDFNRLKVLTDRVSVIVWVTGGGLTTGARPEFAFASSLSRAIRQEQPSTKFVTVDVDDPRIMLEQTASNILNILKKTLGDTLVSDSEFAQVQGKLHVSRFVPAKQLNRAFQQKRSLEIIPKPLNEATPCQLAFEVPGQLDTAYFKQTALIYSHLEATLVEVDVKRIVLDASVIDILLGNVDTYRGTLTSAYSGIVTKIGSGVSSILPGDKVAVMAPGFFATSERLPEWACIKLEGNENFDVASNFILDYSTAIYALHHRARICAGETMLICSGACSLGIAAIQVARLAGADIMTIVETQEERSYLIAHSGLSKDRILLSTSPEYLNDLLRAMDEHIDILVSHSMEDFSETMTQALRHFGRIIFVDDSSGDNFCHLHSQLHYPNLSFDRVCMRDLYSSKSRKDHRTWAR